MRSKWLCSKISVRFEKYLSKAYRAADSVTFSAIMAATMDWNTQSPPPRRENSGATIIAPTGVIGKTSPTTASHEYIAASPMTLNARMDRL